MFSIGQVLFIVLTKKNQLYPMQVVETITKRTLNGEEVSYIVQAGPSAETRVFLDKIEGEIFENAEKARQALLNRATFQINRLVDGAIDKSVSWYKSRESVPQTINDLPDIMSKPQAYQEEDESSIVTMPDGSVVKIKIPKIVSENM